MKLFHSFFFREKLKMERENFWKDYAEKRKVANKQQRTEVKHNKIIIFK